MRNTCVVGIGSPHGDDRFGWVVADRLAAEVSRRGLSAVRVRRALSPAQVLDWVEGLERLLLIDACQRLAPVNELLRLAWPAREWRDVRGSGSHDYSVWQTLELASRLGVLPPSCQMWCVPGTQFQAETPLSQTVAARVPQVVEEVLGELTK